MHTLLPFSFELGILLASALVITAVLVSRISSAYGVPALLLFLLLGMLAGSEGLGQIPFDNYELAYSIGSVALALILFDGGLRTSLTKTRSVLVTGASLSVNATLLTAITTGIFTHFALNVPWQEALLLGAIISSTDAAAVFSILRSSGLQLSGRLKRLLEFEAGSNDPVAAFLTIAVLTFLRNTDAGFTTLISLFFSQITMGAIVGFAAPWVFRNLINRAGVEFEGLYGVLTVGLTLFTFALTNSLGGSGFLAVYLAGLLLSDRNFLHKTSIVRFVDAIAWTSQIAIFLVLGLLVFPSQLFVYWREGLAVAIFLAFVARPLSVSLAMIGSPFRRAERTLTAWIGLRGAAPIILATLPLSVGLEGGEAIFNIVFFVVFVSVLIQGISMPELVRKLGLSTTGNQPGSSTPSLSQDSRDSGADSSLNLSSDFARLKITVGRGAAAAGRRIVDLGLPAGVLLTSIERGSEVVVPQGMTVINENDLLSGFAKTSVISEVESIFMQSQSLLDSDPSAPD